MNKQVLEIAFAQAAVDRFSSDLWMSDETSRVSEAESSTDKTYPCLTVTAEQITPVAGHGNYCSVVMDLMIESQVEGPESDAAVRHAARVEDVCAKLDMDFLTAINLRAGDDFECLGFAERPPVYGIEGRIWSAGIKIICGIIWVRQVFVVDDSTGDQVIDDSTSEPVISD